LRESALNQLTGIKGQGQGFYALKENPFHTVGGLGEGRNQNDGGYSLDPRGLGYSSNFILIPRQRFSVFLFGSFEVAYLQVAPKSAHALRDFPLEAVDHSMSQ
jgi:hypothetical protein